MTAAQLAELRVPGVRLAAPFAFLGRLTLPFCALVDGEPGSGKSTLITGLARALSGIAPTVYVSAEEGHRDTFADRLRRLDANHPRTYIADAHDVDRVLDLVDATGALFVVLDSATHFDATSKEITRLWRELKERGVSLVAVAHNRTDGKTKGGSFLKYDVDVVLSVESGQVHTVKTRLRDFSGGYPVAFTADEVAEHAAEHGHDPYAFEVFDEHDRPLGTGEAGVRALAERAGMTYFKNGDYSRAQYAAMFADMEERGTRESPKGSSPKNRKKSSTGGSSGGGSQRRSAARKRSGASTSARSVKASERAARALQEARDAVASGTLTQGRTKYTIEGTYRTASGQPVVAARSADGSLALAYVAPTGLTWKKGVAEDSLDGFSEVAADELFANASDTETKPPAKRKKATSANRKTTKKPKATKPKKAPKKRAPKATANATAEPRDADPLAGFEDALAEIKSLLVSTN